MDKYENFKKSLSGIFEVVVFFAVMATITTLIVQYGEKEKQRQEKLDNTENQILKTRKSVDSLRSVVPLLVRDSLNKHPENDWVMKNQHAIDDLKYKNRVLTDEAFFAARADAPDAKIRRNKKMFYDFYHLPAVKNAYWQIYMNEKKIEEFDKQKQKLENLSSSIQKHFDSTTNAKVAVQMQKLKMLESQRDSLINKKSR